MEERGLMGMSTPKPPLYVCAYVPEFPAQALLRLRPALSHSAVAVIAGDPPLEQVCSANARALRLGVAQGMTRAELETFSDLTVIRRAQRRRAPRPLCTA